MYLFDSIMIRKPAFLTKNFSLMPLHQNSHILMQNFLCCISIAGDDVHSDIPLLSYDAKPLCGTMDTSIHGGTLCIVHMESYMLLVLKQNLID